MFYLIGLAVLVSGGLLVVALCGLRATGRNGSHAVSAEERAPVTMRRGSGRPSFPLPKPPPLGRTE